MAKVPVAGAVKTRLARQIGVAEALRFYRATSRAVLGRIGRQPFWETIIAVTPGTGTGAPVWPQGMARMGQGQGDLGARMQRPMQTLPPGPVCVIGTDVPDINVALVRRAFRLLGPNDFVFGPAEDGGFWLVGQRRRPRVTSPYANVRWSHAGTLTDVLANLKGRKVAFTGRLHDVDEPRDLECARASFGRRIK